MMSTRSVRLDNEAELALDYIVKRTGMSISDAIKQGLISYREVAMQTTVKHPSDFFCTFDLGEGGDALTTARDSKSKLKMRVKERLSRDK